MKIERIWNGPDSLGEGPIWHVKEQALYWIDIVEHKIHRLDYQTKAHQAWQMPDVVCALVPHAKGGMLASVGDSIIHVDIPSGKIKPIVAVIPGQNDLRLNDGKCDRKGRFWAGVACFDRSHPKGGLFCLDTDGTLTQMESGITISNGLGWSPDNRTFYYTNGLEYVIYAYDFDLEAGTISNRRVFVQLEESPVEPDGLTVDSEGYVWAARWEGGVVVRYAPDGSVDRELKFPVTRPTSCIFGGPNLDILYVTSCSQSFGESQRLPAPAGSIFAVNVSVKGLPEPAYQPR